MLTVKTNVCIDTFAASSSYAEANARCQIPVASWKFVRGSVLSCVVEYLNRTAPPTETHLPESWFYSTRSQPVSSQLRYASPP